MKNAGKPIAELVLCDQRTGCQSAIAFQFSRPFGSVIEFPVDDLLRTFDEHS